MKTSWFKIGFTFLLLLFITVYSQAQRFLVRIRPAAPVAVRVAAPGPRYVWVDGDWVWRNGAYVYQQGYWYLPRGRERWIRGHWRKAGRGWYWVPGHWSRRR